MPNHNKLKVAEHFHSIQGEGFSAGIPCVFLRLSMCPLSCSFCDTVDVWKGGKWYTFPELEDIFKVNGYLSALASGSRLVLTGGDPMLQQEALICFFEYLESKGFDVRKLCVVEIETQATIMPLPQLFYYVNQWNISPKLANSGMPKDKRLKPDVLKVLARLKDVQFKFPISSYHDIEEVFQVAAESDIAKEKITLMPICNNQQSHVDGSLLVTEMCKQWGLRYSPRLQLAIWNLACGV